MEARETSTVVPSDVAVAGTADGLGVGITTGGGVAPPELRSLPMPVVSDGGKLSATGVSVVAATGAAVVTGAAGADVGTGLDSVDGASVRMIGAAVGQASSPSWFEPGRRHRVSQLLPVQPPSHEHFEPETHSPWPEHIFFDMSSTAQVGAPDSIALKNERCLACVGSSPYSMSEIWPPSTPGIRMTVWICGSFASSADTRNAPPALMPITSGSFTSIADAGGIVNVPRIVARTRYETDVEPRGRLSAYQVILSGRVWR